MRTDRKLKALGFCLTFALCLVAVMAASAQAARPNWMHAGVEATGTLEFKGEKDVKDFVLLTKTGLSKIEILCEELTLKDGLLFVGGTELAELEFHKGCVTRLNGVASGPCKPAEPMIWKVKDKLVLREDLSTKKIEALQLLEPEEGTTFTTIKLGEGECAFGTNISITGSFLMEDCNHEMEAEKITHLVEQAPDGLYKQEVAGEDTLKFGSNALHLDGSLNLLLAGAHVGETWSGLAP